MKWNKFIHYIQSISDKYQVWLKTVLLGLGLYFLYFLLGPVKKTILYAPGKNEEAYIMDAKVIGNLGRYMNHSCRPNVFVQNVFVSIISEWI